MDVLNLLRQARAAGLRVSHDGDRLDVRGPVERSYFAEELGQHKAEVLAALRAEAAQQNSVLAHQDGAETAWQPGVRETTGRSAAGWRLVRGQWVQTGFVDAPELSIAAAQRAAMQRFIRG